MTPHSVHVRSVASWRFGRERGRYWYVAFAAAARHGLQIFLRYVAPFVGV